jgi:hypothetical protein
MLPVGTAINIGFIQRHVLFHIMYRYTLEPLRVTAGSAAIVAVPIRLLGQCSEVNIGLSLATFKEAAEIVSFRKQISVPSSRYGVHSISSYVGESRNIKR